ncbi:outer membrane protein assembly factor BamB family protein [Cellulomonas edaphi]|uniref:PQQ-binding-like beta-propeller repeat protein n=1 Tax=Cellulomonas edaphi TaxID=3053468 RepID=A0ABT7S7D1_9CELL|nr:PQQ-binding-like beta-propeller repeat protein [Cellulomons edaphi]MDM7831536.1 PQQ-binding-like beta-propeller repeat protein [Cellulomons edaphi]
MRPNGREPTVSVVELDEVEDGAAARSRGARGPLWGWARRRPVLAAVAGTLAVGLLVGFVLVAPHVAADRERVAVLEPAAFDGAVHSLARAPRERWSAPAASAMAPVLVGDVVVVAQDSPVLHLAGLDVVTGKPLWRTEAIGTTAAPVQGCVESAARLACIVGLRGRGERPPSRVVLVDVGTGRVLADHPVQGRWVEIEAVDDDVVLAGWVPAGMGVVRVDPTSGAQEWTTPPSDRAHPRATGNIGLAVAGRVVVASSFPAQMAIDAADGHPLPVAISDDLVRLRPDGVYVRTRFESRAGGVSATSVLMDGAGRVVRTARGEAVIPAVHDPASPRVLTVEATRGGVGVRAYTDGAAPLWRAAEPAGWVVADAGGRVVVERNGSLVGLDAASGERVWQRPAGVESRSAFSDGDRVAVLVNLPGSESGMAALRLADGDREWQVALPTGTRRVVRLGAELYALSTDRLVALR